ncbi:MAG: hypothetical protein H0U70_01000 [Tatlockia sp.]|nr:hypothetical protein [Tatlockia sp.]
MSIFKVEVVPINLEPHPHADTLSILKVYGYTVCVRTADWKDKKIGAYIPPESIALIIKCLLFYKGILE